MCAACAMAAAAGVTGLRSWLQTRRWRWMTPRRLRGLTLAACVVGLAFATVTLSGSSAPTAHPGSGSLSPSQAAAR